MRSLAILLCVAAQMGGFPVPVHAYGPDVRGWTAAVFAGAPPPPVQSAATLELRQQDFGQLGINQSVVGTKPLRIAQAHFERGLGAHANSEIVVHLPTARAFQAMVGVDNNYATRGASGSVQFLVEIGGKSVFHSRTLRGADQPLAVKVPIPPEATQLVLKVDTTPDGPTCDHADWAAAQLVMQDGSPVWLDELPLQPDGEFWPAVRPPFSFMYHGESSETLLSSWTRAASSHDLSDRAAYETQWTDSQTGLSVTAHATAFKDFAAVEWFLSFRNAGTRDTPILENIQALDVTLRTAPAHKLVLDQINGDDASERSFVPVERGVAPGQAVTLAPAGGRPSSGTFPMFDVQQDARGLFTAIGWTGQWAASVKRDSAGATRLQAGMELTHLLLHPGESIRSPRILLLPWSGDRTEAHNLFRRLLLAHYLPKIGGQAMPFAFAAQSFNEGPPGWGTEAGQLAAARINRDLGCDTLWMDAGWFVGGFPNGTGNWIPRPVEFPHGLKPVGEACQKLGLKFLVWYEPERVCQDTEIAREHPEFVLPGHKAPGAGGLFNLGDPAARRWLTDLLARQITEFHIHTYRNDFNMDPLPFWRQNDPPERQGITEIRYVEGLYAMWDELRARFPQMGLDNCASGGRRIDLEMITRSVVQTRSDAAVAPGRSDWDQSQTYGLNLFLPLHATIGWEVGAYECRSSATAGFCAEWNILAPDFPLQRARTCIAEMKANRKYWTGDYYPLTPWTMAPDGWMAWQLHRADLNEGMVLAFRHQESPYSALQVSLQGIKPDQRYVVHFIDEQQRDVVRTLRGRELAALECRIPARHQSLLIRYAPR